MRPRNENKLCCLVGNISVRGEEDVWPCTCEFRYCNGCYDIWVNESSEYFPEYNGLVDAHVRFDPDCKYNAFLHLRIKTRKEAALRWTQAYEPQAKNETSQEGSKST